MSWRLKHWCAIALVVAAATVLMVGGGLFGHGDTHSGSGLSNPPIYHMDTDHAVYAGIDEVSSAASVIVAGKVLSQSTEPGTPTGTDALGDPLPPIPHTNYGVEVSTVLRGSNSSGEAIVVSMAGGSSPEGAFVLDGAPPMHIGDVDLFFLAAGGNGNYYPLSGGAAIASQQSDGSFLLPPDATGGEPLPVTESAVLASLSRPTHGGDSTTPVTGSMPFRMRLHLATNQRLARVLSRGLRVGVVCSAPCTARGQLALEPLQAKALGLSRGHRAVIVASDGQDRGGKLVMKFTAKAKHRLRRFKSLTLSLVVYARGSSGGKASERRTVHLRSGA